MSILEFLQPSPEQRPAVEARGRDIVVTAGAGAGKTRTLVARYLALLDEGLPVRSVIAITFTRKAALEMRNRIRERISAYLGEPGLSADARARWEEIYGQMDGARIGTIHSLCGDIIRSHPAEAGVDPRFTLLDETRSALLRAESVAEALDEADLDDALLACVDALGMDRLSALLTNLMGRRTEAAPALSRAPAALEETWRGAARAALAVFMEHGGVRDAMRGLAEIRNGPAFMTALTKGDTLAPYLPDAVFQWQALEQAWAAEDMPAVIAALPTLAKNLQKGKGKAALWGADNPKPLIAAARDVYDEAIKPLLNGVAWEQDLQALRMLPAIQRLFADAAERYGRARAGAAQLDFDDLEELALNLLKNAPAARAYWQAETRAVLVDEYQDTNPRQAELARLLAGQPGRLFVVGDGKQSIYRFRGGDVTVIRAEKERAIAEGGLEAHVGIDLSYRAHRPLLDGLNTLLRPVLGEALPDDPDWKQAFEPLEAFRAEPRPGFVAPHIELHLAVKGEGERSGAALARVAATTADAIGQWVGAGTMQAAAEDGHLRPLRFDDIVILCRASSSFKAYEDALERAGIPYLTVGGSGFFERPEVRDVVNLLRVIETPHDDAAFAGALRSPVFGVTDYALALLFDGRDRARSAWAQWPERIGRLEPADQSAVAAAVGMLTDMQTLRGRVPVAQLLKELLDRTLYLPALLGAGHARGRRNIEKLLATARDSATPSVRAFLEYATAMRDSGAREGEARAVAEGAVQIMTAHAAKGLEFPVVVLGDAGRQSGGGRDFVLHPAWGLVLRLTDAEDRKPFLYALAARAEQEQDEAEAGRLLYVAATRAEEKLAISADIALKKDGTPGNVGGWLKLLCLPGGLPLMDRAIAHDPAGAALREMDLSRAEIGVIALIREPGAPLPPRPGPTAEAAPTLGDLRLVAPLPPAGADRRHDAFLTRVTSRVARSDAPASIVGKLTHRAVQLWRVAPPDLDWLRTEAQTLGLVEPRQIEDAVNRSRRILARFAAHPLYAEMGSSDQRLHEVPYAWTRDGAPVSGIIDCLYRHAGHWKIVDFKTDQLRNRAAMLDRITARGYDLQVNTYAAAAEAFLGERPAAALCFLDVGGAVEVF